MRRRRDENLIRYLNTCNRQEAKCMFPFHFDFQLSKDVRTRLEVNRCWIPWICYFLILRSMKVDWSATNFWWTCFVHRACLYLCFISYWTRRWVTYLFFIIFFPISIWFNGRRIFDSLSQSCFIFKKPLGSERVQECVHALED